MARLDGTILSIRRLRNLLVPFRLSPPVVGGWLNPKWIPIAGRLRRNSPQRHYQRSGERKSRARRVMVVPLWDRDDSGPVW
jgi:hypothetical protein